VKNEWSKDKKGDWGWIVELPDYCWEAAVVFSPGVTWL